MRVQMYAMGLIDIEHTICQGLYVSGWIDRKSVV